MSSERAIGVFDSGIGGLSVLKQLVRFMPDENFVYLGDTARVPYGNKSKETVEHYSRECASFLLKKEVKLIVVACNTASSIAIPAVQELAGEIDVVDMIAPAAEGSLRSTVNNNIGVIGTRATVSSEAYSSNIKNLAKEESVNVYSRACPLFVNLVEEGMIEHKATRLIAEEYLSDLRNSSIDSLVLGCTHYPFLARLISEILPGVSLIDSGEHAAVHALRILAEKNLLKENSKKYLSKPKIDFYVTDYPSVFYENAQNFLGFKLSSPIKISLEQELI